MISIPALRQDEKLKLFHALFVLGNNPETKPVIEWLSSELNRLDKTNRIETDQAILHQRQGACQVLEILLDSITKAKDRYITVQDQLRNP